jgi:hypothetical protein
LVWTSPTDTGVVGRARNAAAAAAADSDALEAWFLRNAEAAAVAALVLAVEEFKGCRRWGQSLLSCDTDARCAYHGTRQCDTMMGSSKQQEEADDKKLTGFEVPLFLLLPNMVACVGKSALQPLPTQG